MKSSILPFILTNLQKAKVVDNSFTIQMDACTIIASVIAL